MTHLGAPGNPLDDESGTYDLPRPTKPDEKILRELAKAGLSKRGLIVASDRRTARRIRAGLAREEWLRRFRLRLAKVRAKVLAAVRRARPLVAVLRAGRNGRSGDVSRTLLGWRLILALIIIGIGYAFVALIVKVANMNHHVVAGSKAGAILIGLAFLVFLYVVTALITGHWRVKELFIGFDGFGSTSKLQWLLWLIAVGFGYVAIWALRAENGDYTALSGIPVNILTVLGFSTATAAAAKGITAGYVQTGKVAKTGVPANPTAATTGGIFQDDSGSPELAKIQMMAFTIIGIGIFLATVLHQIAIGDIKDSLPNIDSSLLVLMGISQGGYLGKKLVTFGTPALFAPNPLSGSPGTPVTVTGSGLGAQQSSSQLLLNGAPIAVTAWSDSSIQFAVPADDPATGVAWASLPKAVPLAVSITGQLSNSATFKVN